MKPKFKILAFLTLSLMITMSFANCNNAGIGEDDIFAGIPYRDLVSVPGGEFNQISAVAGLPNFDHELSAFKIAQYQVTYELWHKVKQWAEDNGYTFANDGQEGHDGTEGDQPTDAEHEPVTNISWRDAIVWCNAYSEMAGLTPGIYV
jgi:formylglycine-generating enzyme required for sulfatase activity